MHPAIHPLTWDKTEPRVPMGVWQCLHVMQSSTPPSLLLPDLKSSLVDEEGSPGCAWAMASEREGRSRGFLDADDDDDDDDDEGTADMEIVQ